MFSASAGLIAGSIAAGGALLGGAANAVASGSANKRTIAYNKWALNQLYKVFLLQTYTITFS